MNKYERTGSAAVEDNPIFYSIHSKSDLQTSCPEQGPVPSEQSWGQTPRTLTGSQGLGKEDRPMGWKKEQPGMLARASMEEPGGHHLCAHRQH